MRTFLFKPYTSVPKQTDKNFINTSYGGYSHCIKRNSKGYTLPNCVAFVHGMWLKVITDAKGLTKAKEIESRMCRNNAEVYWNYNDGFERGQTPKLGAIMVWEGKGSLAGHVMTVTEVKPNGDVIATGSDYSGSKYYTKTYFKAKGYEFNATKYHFYGFIYIPYEFVYKTGTPVARNASVPQIEVVASALNVRADASTHEWSCGICNTGIYNILDTAEDSDYKWYKIGEDQWIANNKAESWCTVLPVTVPKYDLTMHSLNKGQCDAMVAWCKGEGVEYTVTEV